MKKSTLVILGMVLVAASYSFTLPDDPLYKNLKVLPKKITKHQMDSVMRHFTAALGVKCNFCHVRTADNKEWDFASDANKHKQVARNMMKMTAKLNKKYFDVTGNKGLDAHLMVTCYTCHNGKPEPLTNPPAPPQTGPRSDSARKQ